MKAFLTYILITLLFCSCPAVLHAEEIVLSAVGDVMLAGKWTPLLKAKGYDYPFAGVKSILTTSDLSIANLESPIARGGKEFSGKKFRFRAEPAVASALKHAGISVVTLANNHSMDFGAEALLETLEHLRAKNIAWVGAGNDLSDARAMTVLTVKGRKIAFLGYSLTQPVEFFAGAHRAGTAPGYEAFVRADVARARAAAEYVIVSFHWGKEATGTIQDYQRAMAHCAIDSGADIILGHHPHVLQGVERYKKGIIFYSLGNFTFASKSKTAQVSALIRFRLDDGHREAEIVPLDVLHRRVGFQPQPLSGSRGAAVITTINALSQPFNTEVTTRDGRFIIEF